MIKVEYLEVWGFRHAVRGMRNPMNSWDRSDSYETHIENPETMNEAPFQFFVGGNDLDLMHRLCDAGQEHRKYMRQIFVSMDIIAPLYWWKEYDTYKVGTTSNSCSTMHKIHAKEFTASDFSCERMTADGVENLRRNIEHLNRDRAAYLETNDKDYWYDMIQNLPSSYNQRRTITMTYENAANMIRQRFGHKLQEWRDLVEILCGLPYMAAIIEGANYDDEE